MAELVECHSDFTYAEKPVALTWEDRHLEIVKILVQWRTPQARHFRVQTADGQEFELIYHVAIDEHPETPSGQQWQIHPL